MAGTLVAVVVPNVVEPQPAAAAAVRYEGESYAGTCASGPSYSGASGGASANCTVAGQTANFSGVSVPTGQGGRLIIVVKHHCCSSANFSYRIDGGTWISSTTPFGGSGDGWSTAVDAFNALSAGSHTVDVRFDSGWGLYLDYIDVDPIPIVAAGEPEPWPSFDGYRAFCNISRSGSGPLYYHSNNSRNQPAPYTWVTCNLPASINGTPVAKARYAGLAFIHEGGGLYGFGCCLSDATQPMQSEPGRWLSTRYGYATDNACCNFGDTYILEDPRPHGDMNLDLSLYDAAGNALYHIPPQQIRDEVIGVHEPGPPPWPARYFAGGTPPPAVPIEQCYGLGSSAFGINPCGYQSDPVNSASGSFVTSKTDLTLPGIGIPFRLTRSYTSADTTTGALGPGWTNSYATSLRIGDQGIVLRTDDGQQLQFERRADGSFAPDLGVLSTLSSIPGGYEVKRLDQTVYRFDDQGRLTQVRDRNNQGLTLAYGADGKLSTVTDSGSRAISFTHDASGLLTQVALPDGRSVSYGYTGGRLTSVTDVRGGTTSYSYDASGRLSQIVDQRGNPVATNTYGPDGRVTEQVDALGNRSTFSWDPATKTSTMTDARGNAWRDVYSGNILVRRIDPLGNTTVFRRDEALNLTSVTDARGNTTTMTYDQNGNLLSRTAPPPLSYKESFTYNSRNDVATATDGREKPTTFDYDASGNLIKMTQPGAVITQYGRDAQTGLLTSVTDPRGKTTTFGHDAQGNITSVTTPLGFKTTMGYDGAGRMTSRVEPRGNATGANPADYTWTYTYDRADHLLTTADPLSNTTTFTWDLAGNLSSRKEANTHITSYEYDKANRLKTVTAPDSTTTTYTYDGVGNLTSRTDANLHVTSYDYDAARHLIKVTSPLNQVWSLTYDPNGNLATKVMPSGTSTSDAADGTIIYTYDALNRVTGLNYSDSTPDVTFGYDGNGNRTSMTDGSGTETYSYDDLNRLTGVTRGTDTFNYVYDPAGNVTKRTYPDSTVVNYGYDDDGRLSSVSSGGAITYAYDAAGNLRTATLPSGNGYVETRTYDRAGRLTVVKNAKGTSVLSRSTYTLDPVGNPTQVVTPTGTTTYRYDLLDRLTEVCFQATCPAASDPFIRWTYDPVGNRTSETRASGTTTYTYNVGDQLLSAGTTTYSYDPNGNQTQKGTRTFAYDLANRLTSTTNGTATTTYGYDGDGKRLLASTGSLATQKTKYLWDPNHSLDQLALERDGNDALLRRYIHGTDLVSMFTGGASYYYHRDGLGSVVNLTSATGATQWTYAYEPFGANRTQTKNNTNAPGNVMRFTGQLRDGTGLYHLRARQYDPGTGRFLMLDPATPTLGEPYVASYAYVGNRPTSLVDPSGETAQRSNNVGLWSLPSASLNRGSGSLGPGPQPGNIVLVQRVCKDGFIWVVTIWQDHSGSIWATRHPTWEPCFEEGPMDDDWRSGAPGIEPPWIRNPLGPASNLVGERSVVTSGSFTSKASIPGNLKPGVQW